MWESLNQLKLRSSSGKHVFLKLKDSVTSLALIFVLYSGEIERGWRLNSLQIYVHRSKWKKKFEHSMLLLLIPLSIKEWLKNVAVSTLFENPIFSIAKHPSLHFYPYFNLPIAQEILLLPCILHMSLLTILYSHQCDAGNRALADSSSTLKMLWKRFLPFTPAIFLGHLAFSAATEEKLFSLPFSAETKA